MVEKVKKKHKGGQRIDKRPIIVSIVDRNDNEYSSFLNKVNKLSPLSGSEPKYEPNKWNKDKIAYNHNCYSYLLNTISATRSGKPQPGYFSNFDHIKNSEYNCKNFYKRLKKDIPSLYLSNYGEKCKKGFYKGFMAIDPKSEDPDYHFYRQDSNGYWSHKPGRKKAINYDADKKLIINPYLANRNYKYFDYSLPCPFFCLNQRLSSSYSVKSK